ncbi:MAG: cbb3-type cytochrome c oxidase subunit 3 [Rhodobacteraceae bacterium]|nr:cbb3-type cytochrome c oxidase subunit 3 [Paracoccaceae bacterium]
METYTLLREFADSWALLALFLCFLVVVIYTFRRSSKTLHRQSAEIPFRHEDAPASETESGGS